MFRFQYSIPIPYRSQDQQTGSDYDMEPKLSPCLMVGLESEEDIGGEWVLLMCLMNPNC